MAITRKMVEELMARRGIESISQLAERSGINRTHIYTLWTREGSASLATLRKVAHALRVPVAMLIGDEAPPPADPHHLSSADLEFLAQLATWANSKVEGRVLSGSVTYSKDEAIGADLSARLTGRSAESDRRRRKGAARAATEPSQGAVEKSDPRTKETK